MKELKFGNYFCTNGVPQIEVVTPDRVAYLSAFRRYSFQISATPEGEWDLASSPVIGLEALIDIKPGLYSNHREDGVQTVIAASLAMSVISEFCRKEDLLPPRNNYGVFLGRGFDQWNLFLENTLMFANHEQLETVDLVETIPESEQTVPGADQPIELTAE